MCLCLCTYIHTCCNSGHGEGLGAATIQEKQHPKHSGFYFKSHSPWKNQHSLEKCLVPQLGLEQGKYKMNLQPETRSAQRMLGTWQRATKAQLRSLHWPNLRIKVKNGNYER